MSQSNITKQLSIFLFVLITCTIIVDMFIVSSFAMRIPFGGTRVPVDYIPNCTRGTVQCTTCNKSHYRICIHNAPGVCRPFTFVEYCPR